MFLKVYTTITTLLCLNHTSLKPNEEKVQNWRQKGGPKRHKDWGWQKTVFPLKNWQAGNCNKTSLLAHSLFSFLTLTQSPPRIKCLLSLEVFCLFPIKPTYHPPSYTHPFFYLFLRWQRTKDDAEQMIGLVLLKTLSEIVR